MKYFNHISGKSTPQTEPLFGETQIKNAAGGYTFEVDGMTFLNRFLTLGTEGGTFYVGERELTVESSKKIVQLIKTNGEAVAHQTVAMIKQNRLPKLDAALFTLALAATYGDAKAKKVVYDNVSNSCPTATHLFTFLANVQSLRGWSRGLRTGVSRWYLDKSFDKLAYQLVKYRQRNGWTHKDVLRLSHPSTSDSQLNGLLRYAVGKADPAEIGSPLIEGFHQAIASKNPVEIARLISDKGLTWEMIPTNFLNDLTVQAALIDAKMPLTALMRNLNRFTASGLLSNTSSSFTKLVASRLTNEEALGKSRMHPVNILNALTVYGSGHGDKGSLTWTPNQRIVAALEDMFHLSFNFVQGSGKDLLLAVDKSGSMTSDNIARMSINPAQASAAIALAFLKSEPNSELILFDTAVTIPKINKNSSYSEVLKAIGHGGGTDVSLPYRYAIEKKLVLDGIVTLTDNETWAGSRHASQVWGEYKRQVKQTKTALVAMTATSSTQFGDADDRVLNCSGFDAGIPKLVTDFFKGE